MNHAAWCKIQSEDNFQSLEQKIFDIEMKFLHQFLHWCELLSKKQFSNEEWVISNGHFDRKQAVIETEIMGFFESRFWNTVRTVFTAVVQLQATHFHQFKLACV